MKKCIGKKAKPWYFIGLGFFMVLLFGLYPLRSAKAVTEVEWEALQAGVVLMAIAVADTCFSSGVEPLVENIATAINVGEQADEEDKDGEAFGQLQSAQVQNEATRGVCNTSEVTEASLKLEALIVDGKDILFPGTPPILVIREVCNNNIDDDADKLIDCDDPDCAKAGTCR